MWFPDSLVNDLRGSVAVGNRGTDMPQGAQPSQGSGSVRFSEGSQGLTDSRSSLRGSQYEIRLMDFNSLGSSSKYGVGLGSSQGSSGSATRTGGLCGSQYRYRSLDFSSLGGASVVGCGLGATSQRLDSFISNERFSQGLSGSTSRSGVLRGSQDESSPQPYFASLGGPSRGGAGLGGSAQGSTNFLRSN